MRTVEAVGRELRRARGKEKQQAIARAAGISDTTLSRIEHGQRPEGLEILLRVLGALGLELSFRRRGEALTDEDPALAVEEALKADPELKEHSREVILAAYRRARLDDDSPAARPKARAVASSR